MKSNEFAKFLTDFGALLGKADNNSAVGFSSLQKILASAGTKQVSAALKLIDDGAFSSAGYFQPKLGDTISDLMRARDFVRIYSKKTLADDVGRVLSFVEKHREIDATKFVDQAHLLLAAKSKKTSRALKPGASDTDINNYLQRLDQTFGFEPDFYKVFEELKADTSMKAPQLRKLAKLFTKMPAKSASAALASIYRRHANILEADKHKAAVGGRVG